MLFSAICMDGLISLGVLDPTLFMGLKFGSTMASIGTTPY